MIQVDIDRETNHCRNIYNIDWSRLPFTWTYWASNRPLYPQGPDIEKPLLLPDLLEITERLAKHLPAYIRIDWYIVGRKIYFGEVTFHNAGGFRPISPAEWDQKLGEKILLPKLDSERMASGISSITGPS